MKVSVMDLCSLCMDNHMEVMCVVDGDSVGIMKGKLVL